MHVETNSEQFAILFSVGRLQSRSLAMLNFKANSACILPMRSSLNCQLLIPDLFWSSGNEAGREQGFPALCTLLGRANSARGRAQDMEEWLCRAFAVNKQQDWPVAALTLVSDGGSPDDEYWLRADPVYLRLDSGQLLLADTRSFAITAEEADRLTQSLNSHFSGAGMLFYVLHPERWYLRVAIPPQLQTRLLAEVVGKNIDEFLPVGKDSIYWHGVYNEIQMVLHDHAVNEAREAAGNPPVNSVWLWGGGRLPDVVKKPSAHVWTDECLAKGLALASGAGISSLPQNAQAWLAQTPAAGAHLLILDSLRAAAQYRDRARWLEDIQQLEIRWFAPLLTALQRGEIQELTISSGAWSFIVARADLWKLWRRSTAFADYA